MRPFVRSSVRPRQIDEELPNFLGTGRDHRGVAELSFVEQTGAGSGLDHVLIIATLGIDHPTPKSCC